MNRFIGQLHDSEIQKLVCNTYIHDGKYSRHFEAGEQKCRECALYFKSSWTKYYCPRCGNRLAYSSRHRDRSKRYVNAY